jgi:hypothetical protein
MYKKFKFLFCFAVILCAKAEAQNSISGKITGRIVDEYKTPFGYATVNVLKATDSTFFKGMASADNGTFALDMPDGSYLMVHQNLQPEVQFD